MIVERGRKVRHVRVSPNDCKKPKLSNALKEREIVRFPSIRSKSGRASNSESDGQSLQRTKATSTNAASEQKISKKSNGEKEGKLKRLGA